MIVAAGIALKFGGGRPLRKAGETLKNEKDGLAYVWVPPGEFKMGCDDTGCWDNEKPVHDVEISGYWMGQTEVPQAAGRK